MNEHLTTNAAAQGGAPTAAATAHPGDSDALERLLAGRFSCRAFLPDLVPVDVIRRILELAQRTASWCNSQPWHVHLTSGEETLVFAKALTARATDGPETPDIPNPTAYEGVYLERRRGAGYGLYNAVGIARDDLDARGRQMQENFRFFGAPHVAVISTPKNLGPFGAIDCGGYVSTLMIAAQSMGIATIAQAAISRYADLVHEYFDIPVDRDIVCAISFGYGDLDHPANAFRTDRAAINQAVTGGI